MLNEKKNTVKFRLLGILLFCMVLVGSMLLTPGTAQAARGHRGGRRATIARRHGGFQHHRPARRFHQRRFRRHHRPFRHHRRHGTNWGNFGWTIGNAVWTAANIARSRSRTRDSDYYDDTIIIEKPVYVVPRSYDDDDDVDYLILRDWDYTPNTTTTRTEIIICP